MALVIARYLRVLVGFAQIWCSDPFEPMVISRSRCNFGPRLPLPRCPVPLPCSPFYIFHSPFLAPSEFLVPRSSIFVTRSPFLVGVTSHYSYDATVVSSNSNSRKHLCAMSILIRKIKNIWILSFTFDCKKFRTGLYPAEFSGKLLQILSAIRAQKKKKRSKFIA